MNSRLKNAPCFYKLHDILTFNPLFNPFMSRKAKAIKTLEDLKKALEDVNNNDKEYDWRVNAISHIKKFLGPDDILIRCMEKFGMFKTIHRPTGQLEYITNQPKYEYHDIFDPTKKVEAAQIIDNVIQHINTHDLYTLPGEKRTYMNLGDIQFWAAAFSIAAILAGVGFYFGGLDARSEVDRERHEKELLGVKAEQTAIELAKQISQYTDLQLNHNTLRDSIRAATETKKEKNKYLNILQDGF